MSCRPDPIRDVIDMVIVINSIWGSELTPLSWYVLKVTKISFDDYYEVLPLSNVCSINLKS